MKKFLVIGGIVLFLGCGNSQPQPQTQVQNKVVSGTKKVVETAKKIIDPCERNKMTCLGECKISYPTEDDNVKLKACIAKCYTIYAGCKTAEAAKKGYNVKKEVVKKGYQKTKEFIQSHTN